MFGDGRGTGVENYGNGRERERHKKALRRVRKLKRK